MHGLKTAALAAALLAGAAAPTLAGSHTGAIENWEMDPEAGLQKARAKGLPAMLFFTADW